VRDPDSGWIQLSSVEFVLLWSALGLGEPPLVLGIRPVGRTRARRAELVEQASPYLAARDLGTVAEPARDLAIVLRTLGSDGVSVDLRVHGEGAPLYGYAVANGRGAAAVARVGDEVRIGSVSPAGLAGALLGSLPPLPAGSERPANVALPDYLAACAEGERDGVSGFLRVLHGAGVRGSDAATVSSVLTTRRGGGQLGATGRDRRGAVLRAPGTVNWVDTPDGRYALRRNGGWVTVTPVDLARLTAMAEEMLAEVRPG
jgi:hypothetical protein